MANENTNRNSNCPSDGKYAKDACANPRLNALGYSVRITESLETDLLDLGLFCLLLFKHGFSLGERALYHQDEPVPNADQGGYRGIFLALHAEDLKVFHGALSHPPQHQQIYQSTLARQM